MKRPNAGTDAWAQSRGHKKARGITWPGTLQVFWAEGRSETNRNRAPLASIRFEANLRSNSRVAGLNLAIFGSSHSGLRRARRSEGKLAGPIRFASIIDLTRPGLGPMTSGLKGSAAHQLGGISPPRHGCKPSYRGMPGNTQAKKWVFRAEFFVGC